MASPQEILAAIKRVRSALSNKDLIAFQTHYLLKDERIHAQNGRVQASAPCPVPGEFLVAGAEFERAVDKLPTDKLVIEQDVETGTVKVKGGRFRTTIQTLPVDLVPDKVFEVGQVAFDSAKFAYALHALRPFISDNATRPFSLCYNFTDGRAMATNNMVIAECTDTGFDPAVALLLPQWAADFIMGMGDVEMLDVGVGRNAMQVRWADGTRMETFLGGQGWPEVARGMLDRMVAPTHEVDEEWRRDVLALRELGENEITFHADYVDCGKGRSRTRLDIPTPTPQGQPYTRWTFEFIEPILERATHIDFTNWPKPMAFAWRNVQGIAAART